MIPQSDRLLIYAPVPLYQTPTGLWQEDQACNGLKLWADNFEHVTVMMPLKYGTPPPSWEPIETVGPNLDRISIIPLPEAYRPDRFFRQLRRVRSLIKEEISKADYVAFSIGGLFGDWGSVGCWEAYKMQRPYAVWTDRVESEVCRRTIEAQPTWRRRMLARVSHRPMAWLEKFLIKRATLGLFHGKETFEAYAPYCRQPFVVHDIHISKSKHISEQALKDKIDAAKKGSLKIAYAGRADAMKGPMDWIEVLENLVQQGIDFEAIWMGDGPCYQEMVERTNSVGLNEKVRLLGFVRDRDEILAKLRESNIFLFCHKTPESPRCLIEALVSGTPIIGYDGAFARDLISEHGGGRLVEMNNVSGLSNVVEELFKNRKKLTELISASARDGAPFDDVSVFHHRSDLIRRYLKSTPED